MRLPRWRSPHPLADGMAWLLVVFLVLFPKGGIKLGPLPITWGYLILALSAPLLLTGWVAGLPARIRSASLPALLAIVPFQLVFLYSVVVNGVGQMDYTVSLAVSFFVLPWLFLGVYPLFTSRLTPGALRRWFCTCIFYAAAFGLVLFFSYPFTHHLLQVPYLTVNAADYGQIALTKHIARGAFLKLIATYNNGNVYGAATLLVLPLFSLLEPRAWRRWAVRAALFLTLSRTIWAGLLAEQLLSLAPPLLSSLGTLPTLRLRGAGRQLLLIGGTALTILVVLFSASYSLSFLFDPTLSGRSGEFAAATQSTFLPSVPVTGFAEVLFASALITFGLLGCFAVLLVFFFPLLYAALRPAVFTMPIRRAALKGLVLYILISISDSATNLIPVMAFFWFVESVLLFGFPGTPESAAVRSPAPSLLIPVRRRLRRLLVPPEPAATPITPG